MAVNEIYVRSVLQKSGIPGVDYVINPYTGCTHGCVYCYARFMKRFSGHTEPWGTFLDAKVNAPELLHNQFARRKTPLPGEVFLSSVTDPYLPAEKHYCLTRRMLETLLEQQVPVSILTKSTLVLRDMDLLQQFRQVSVGMSMMTTDDKVARHAEPHASAPSQRIQALRTLKEAGVRTYAFFSPYIPGLSHLEQLVNAVIGYVDEIGVEALNVRAGNWTGVEQMLAAHYPEKLTACAQQARDAVYWDVLEQRTCQLAAQSGTAFMGFFRHSA